MKKVLKTIILCMSFFCFILSACSSKDSINGKYVSVYNDEIYYDFDDNNNFTTNDVWFDSLEICNGKYEIDNGFITLYGNNDGKSTFYLGYYYNNYICSKWDGIMPKDYDNSTITCEIDENMTLIYYFYNDKTYKYSALEKDEIVHEEIGNYTIEDNKVICVNSKGENVTFINEGDNIFCIDYIKE